MATRMEEHFIVEEETVQKLRVVCYLLNKYLGNVITFCLIATILRLKNIHFGGKEF